MNSVCGCGGGHGRVGVTGSEYVICGTVFVLGNGHGCGVVYCQCVVGSVVMEVCVVECRGQSAFVKFPVL